MSSQHFTTFCLATVVTSKALDALLEMGTAGVYRDVHPWLIAQQLHAQAAQDGLTIPLLIACQNDHSQATDEGASSAQRQDQILDLNKSQGAVPRTQDESDQPGLAQTHVQPCRFSHWATVTQIETIELHRGKWESRCHFDALSEINPIWESIDSVFIQPSAEQIAREAQENIRVFRTALDEHHIHPYAICETPSFIRI